MEALFQIVGCVLSSKPAAKRIDEFVAQLRRERAVVVVKDAHKATFVRFNAPDARLITLACEAVRSKLPSSLRFGFAAGIKEPTQEGQDGLSISNRGIAQAPELATGARDGEVLVSPQFAMPLIEAGFALHSKQVHLPDGRIVAACLLDLTAGVTDKDSSGAPPLAESKAAEALGTIYQTLMAQAGEMARKQADLDARLDAALSKLVTADEGTKASTHRDVLEAELDGQLMRLKERLRVIDELEARVNSVHATASEVERKVAEQAKAMADRDALEQARTSSITSMLGDIHVNLEMLSEQRAVIDHVGEKLARLDFTVQEAQNTLRALQREREVAERVEQGIKALRTRASTSKLS
jgi:hypothetical protein